MRMAELSTTSDVPVATIKYYLREKLLPAGESETANQARYGSTHLDRLRLIRALIDVGGLSVVSPQRAPRYRFGCLATRDLCGGTAVRVRAHRVRRS